MKILAIDPGTIKAGWGFIETDDAGTIERYEAGVIDLGSTRKVDDRVTMLAVQVQQGIKRFNPEVVVYEEGFISRGSRATLFVGYARAAVMIAAGIEGIRTASYAPTEIKKAVTSRGNADKEQVAQHVAMIVANGNVDMERVNLDATDALAAAICHLNHTDEAQILMRVDRP